jgi:beta-phosphoglucomutase
MANWRPSQEAPPVNKIRALIFDMDGVIVDSNPLHRESWAEYNRRQGVETTEEMHLRMYGKRNDMIIRDFLGADLTDEQVFAHGAAKEALYREMLAPRLLETIVPGLQGFLERHSDLPKAVATNAEPPNVEFVLREAGLARFFKVIVDGHQVPNPKPHPDVYLRAADLLGIATQECVVFEDSHGGVAAALAAGMRVIGITTTYSDLPGASLLARDFNDPAIENWLRAGE